MREVIELSIDMDSLRENLPVRAFISIENIIDRLILCPLGHSSGRYNAG
jgi:hypothetical protein